MLNIKSNVSFAHLFFGPSAYCFWYQLFLDYGVRILLSGLRYFESSYPSFYYLYACGADDFKMEDWGY
jgi:hypothetical protein